VGNPHDGVHRRREIGAADPGEEVSLCLRIENDHRDVVVGRQKR
jgi:hypothetical protein